MSGGALDYAYGGLQTAAEDIRNGGSSDGGKHEVTPLHLRLAAHLDRVAEVLKEVEWHWSGDSNAQAAQAAMEQLLGVEP